MKLLVEATYREAEEKGLLEEVCEILNEDPFQFDSGFTYEGRDKNDTFTLEVEKAKEIGLIEGHLL